MENRQTNYTIMEGCELPSGGVIYEPAIDPHVELRSMTARDEMKRLSPSTTPLKTLADIIEGCMIEKPAIHVYDMAIGDYEYLLTKLRVITYGKEYKIALTCSECGEFFETSANLDSLEMKDFDVDKYNEAKNFALPDSGDSITLKTISPRILESITQKSNEMKRKYKGANIDFSTFCKLLLCIDTVNGEHLNQNSLETLIDHAWSARDLQKILNQIDKSSTMLGYDTRVTVTCTKCSEDVLTFFRYGPEFFRPSEI